MADAVFLGLDFQSFVFVLLYIGTMPFVMVGVLRILSTLSANFKVRKGFIRVDKLLANDQLRKFWVLPQGQKITFNTINSVGVRAETTMTIKLEKGWVWRDGNIPFIKLDRNDRQIPWEINVVQDVPKEIIDEMADTAYTAGLLLGANFRGDIKKITMMLLIVAIMVGAGILTQFYFWNNLHITTQAVNVIQQTVNGTGTVI